MTTQALDADWESQPRNDARSHPAVAGPSTRGILVFTFFSLLWEGVVFALLGTSAGAASRHIYSILTLLGAISYFFFGKSYPKGSWQRLPLLLFALCFFVSAISSTVFFPIPVSDWIFASYAVTPVLIIFTLRLTGCTLEDALFSIYITGIVASILCIIELKWPVYVLKDYHRASGFGTDVRVVFLKLQATAAAVLGIGFFFSSLGLSRKLLHAFLTALIFSYVVVVSESRLSMLAIVFSAALGWLLLLTMRDRIVAIAIAVLAGMSAYPYIAGKFLNNFTSYAGYMNSDSSVAFRNIEYRYFMQFFEHTYGIGFGFMGRGPDKSNILSFAGNRASYLYDMTGIALVPDDNGIWAALYQFGYLGFALVFCMTIVMAVSLLRLGCLHRRYLPVGFLGCFVISELLSPVPLNFFTLEYSGYFGGLIWFMASEAHARRLGYVDQQKIIGAPDP